MKTLCIAIFATFVFALIIIYYDSQRTKAMSNTNLPKRILHTIKQPDF